MKRFEQLCQLAIVMIFATVPCLADETFDYQAPLPPVAEGAQTLVVIPDTEGYCGRRPHIFKQMMQWVADNQDSRNIIGLLHVGDITNDNAEHEWTNAREIFDVIEGKIPYVLASGNHDYDGTEGRLTYMNDYFKVADMVDWPTWGDAYEPNKLENHYQLFEIQGQPWIILSLEMGPRKAVVEWANKILDKYKDRRAIILTHGYLYYGNQRYNHLRGSQRATPHNYYGDGMDGEELWNALVRKHPNVMMVICGHLSSGFVGYRVDEADYGNMVHQMMVNYEKLKGGYGFFRLLEFAPDGKTVQVRTYSPVTNETLSPVTRGEKPQLSPTLEQYSFTLQDKTRDEPRKIHENPATPLTAPPVHRWSFDASESNKLLVKDLIGRRHGKLVNDAKLTPTGQLVLEGEACVLLPRGILSRKRDISFEFWYIPTADHYNWQSVVYFGDGNDWFHYCHRTLTVHRAEIVVNRHNEDIQIKSVPINRDKFTHVVVTYEHNGADDGRPEICYYRDGTRYGKMPTNLKLWDVDDDRSRIGPFPMVLDELRVYDRTLKPGEVTGNYNHGPNVVNLADRN